MRKIKSLGRTLLALLLTATLLTGCGAGSGKAISAIYVPLDDGDYVLIDRSTGAIFTIPSLDGIEDKSGNPVAASDLTAGNVLKIYGDGVMAASEPGYYAGVTRVVLDKQGKPEDIEAYRDQIDGLTAHPFTLDDPDDDPQPEDNTPIRAMYVPLGESGYIFVDQDVGTVFTVTMPEDMVGLDGEKITRDALVAGNIVNIYGDGIMAESYPGQYFGVTRIEVISAGKPEDINAYQDLIDELYVEPDSSQPPQLQAEYSTQLGDIMATASQGSYQWGGTIACGMHVVQFKGIESYALDGATELTLHFSDVGNPDKLTVKRWPADLLGTQDADAIGEGEEVETALTNGHYTLTAEPGWIYGLNAVWNDRGNAEYGFLCPNR